VSQAHERLRRLLFVVPFVAKNPGRSVEEVAKALGINKDELLEDLDLLTLVGRPPFQPDDFIDIYVDDEGKVFVQLDQRLKAPPRLTAAEGVALAAAARLLEPAAGSALTSALKRLERVLPPGAVDRFRAMAKQLDVALEAPDGIAALSSAIVERREVTFDYFAAGRGQTERRAAQPWELFSHRGQWYLHAFCLSRKEPRLFRLDRIANLAVTDAVFEAREEPQARMPGVAEAGAPEPRGGALRARALRRRLPEPARWSRGGDGHRRVGAVAHPVGAVIRR